MLKKAFWFAAVCGVLAGPVLADQIQLTGVVRDFKRGDQTGGHPDFETCSTVSGHGTYGLVPGLVTMNTDNNAKPVFNPTRPSNDSMKSATYFTQWYNDTPGVNLSAPLTIVLDNGQSGPGGVYTYNNPAFFPIDGKLLGNQSQKDASGVVHNFSFTYELHNTFSYQPGQTFTFIGDDDVWVYVNGTKVIDLGGVHSAQTGTVTLFDGKAFVNSTSFTAGGVVQTVSSSMATSLATKWTALKLTGTCPLKSGALYIDLNLNAGDADVRCNFAGSTVSVYSSAALTSVVLKFSDNSMQSFSGNPLTASSFTGSGAWKGKTLAGVWVKTAQTPAASPGMYYGADGSGGPEGTLDFFFAERHVTSSDFRIDTTMFLNAKPIGTVSPLYD